MDVILSDTIFDIDPRGHGGNHRTAQIQELAAGAGIEIVAMKRTGPTSGWDRYAQGTAFLWRQRAKFLPARMSCLRSWRVAHAHYEAGLREHRGAKVLIWEATHSNNWVAPHVAREHGFAVVAIPQNLETMVPEVGRQHSRKDEFVREMEHLACADAIFCISREEQWLLNIHGLDAQYLPYYPSRQVFENMRGIREQKRIARTDKILILGSAYNPPTRAGMAIQLEWLSRLKGVASVEIAGYGTECFREQAAALGVVVHGSLAQEKLEALLVQTQAVWVHQPAATGILTRVTEMLIAGVPLIGNSVATRSLYHLPGVYTYDTFDELKGLLKLDLPVPDLPEKALAAEQRAARVLRGLVERHEAR